MNKLILLITPVLLTFNTSNTLAEMYKWVDQEGNISYSDQPPFKGAETLDTPALTTMPSTSTPENNSTAPQVEDDAKEEVTKYSYLKITSPENDGTIRNNEGNFSISITVKPPLNTSQGHYFSVSMDGNTVHNKLTTSSTSMKNIDRGTHKLSVSVKNKKGKTLRKSKVTTIHLHRQSAIRKQPR
ncbi:MAG: hypothetical protein DIZ80_11090 [endosymbiont of Galathealinum brachiosum]|uniref:DUF4124 domain-containing protein n=1 Tax=endosymbiont of Galathealinum brachiosum TaxID=2200906 RepID=A0A370DD55_9GAMM|nr:MAG: hypothetical protein DIZ80_11090 [endosymbiont of Galathealinum brachiosum]